MALLVVDHEGHISAVCPRRLAREAAGGQLLLTDGTPVATPERLQTISDECSATNMLSLFRVKRYVLIDHNDRSVGLMPVESTTVLGKRVLKLDSDREHGAIVRAIYADLRMSSAGNTIRLYDAIEIEPDDPMRFASPDNGGALIVTENGHPLGVLIAGEAKRYFLAPLRSWLDERGLTPISALAAKHHNDALNSPAFEIGSIEFRNKAFTESIGASIPISNEKANRIWEAVNKFEHRENRVDPTELERA